MFKKFILYYFISKIIFFRFEFPMGRELKQRIFMNRRYGIMISCFFQHRVYHCISLSWMIFYTSEINRLDTADCTTDGLCVYGENNVQHVDTISSPTCSKTCCTTNRTVCGPLKT
jgi:hypothetical protein